MKRALVIVTKMICVGRENDTFENGQWYPGDEIFDEITEWTIMPIEEVADFVENSVDAICEPTVAIETSHEGWFYTKNHLFEVLKDRILVVNCITKERSYIN